MGEERGEHGSGWAHRPPMRLALCEGVRCMCSMLGDSGLLDEEYLCKYGEEAGDYRRDRRGRPSDHLQGRGLRFVVVFTGVGAQQGASRALRPSP